MRVLVTTILVGLLLATLPGCLSSKQPYLTDERLDRGLVIVLPGIEGRSPLNVAICDGLNAGGVNWAIELYDWTARVPVIGLTMGPIYNLEAEGRNLRKADELADRVKRYQYAYPHRPVVLVGQSGGGAIAVWTAKAMSGGSKVDGVILLAATLSPHYSLTRAISHSERGIVNFYSNEDWFFLGVGTTVAGTMDGEHESSAGKVGFLPPSSKPPKEWAKLFQIPWNPRMAEAGFTGGHVSSGASSFVTQYVAPLVLSPAWDDQVISQLLNGRPPAPATPKRSAPKASPRPAD